MPRRTRVMHIVDKFGVNGSSVTGVGRLFSWWMPRFDTRRFEVSLVGLRPYDDSVARLRETGVEVLCLEKGKFDPTTATALRRAIREREADIVHLHGYGATNFARIATRGLPTKVVVHEHFVDPKIPVYQRLADFALSSITDAGIAVSESVREFMIERRGLEPEQVSVIYNGAPLRDFHPAPPEQALAERRRWGIAADAKVVGTIGRLDEQKGLGYFLEAAAPLAAERSDTVFVIVGDGPLHAELEARAAQLGIAERTIFTGYYSDIRAIQSCFDVQVFPSLWEGTPLTLFEAMAMRRPIVATNVDGLGEVLEDGRNALVTAPRDAAGLAERVRLLLEDEDRAERLAARAAADSRRYDIAETVRQLEAIYDTLTPGGAGRVAAP